MRASRRADSRELRAEDIIPIRGARWKVALRRVAPAPGVNNGYRSITPVPSLPVVDVSLSYRYPPVCNVSPVFHPRELAFFREALSHSLSRPPVEFAALSNFLLFRSFRPRPFIPTSRLSSLLSGHGWLDWLKFLARERNEKGCRRTLRPFFRDATPSPAVAPPFGISRLFPSLLTLRLSVATAVIGFTHAP